MTSLQREPGLGKILDRERSTESYDQMMFFSFGMFIIDTIEYPYNSSIPTKHNLPGGAGLYALLGARLLTPPPFSYSLSWILDAGHDLPQSIITQIESWQTSTRVRHDHSRSTTAAWNGYGSAHDPEFRSFRYLTAKRRLDVEDLGGREPNGVGWHMVCSAGRAAEIVRKLESRRGGKEGKVVVWEPIPDLCSPEEREGVMKAARGVDVVSPNAEELRMFFGVDGDVGSENRIGQDELVAQLMGWDCDENIGALNTACIIREGKDGSTIYFPPGWTATQNTNTAIATAPTTIDNTPPQHQHHQHPRQQQQQQHLSQIHLPAYHDQTLTSQVTDPTGGGNTYLGALAVALAYTYPSTSTNTLNHTAQSPSQSLPPPISRIHTYTSTLPTPSTKHHSLLTASIAACIAASFAIEQHGVPCLETAPSTVANTATGTTTATTKAKERSSSIGKSEAKEQEETELWGGSAVADRIRLYLAREGAGIEAQIRL